MWIIYISCYRIAISKRKILYEFFSRYSDAIRSQHKLEGKRKRTRRMEKRKVKKKAKRKGRVK